MPKLLPKEFHFSHEFAFALHDQIASLVHEGEAAGIFEVSFTFTDPSHSTVFLNLSGDSLWAWLEENGYEDVTHDLEYRQLMVALLADFCHFMSEALHCAEQGKLAVAYSLLRKPLRENLFYLEWLLANSDEFLEEFRREGRNRLSITSSENVVEARKKEIIRDAISKTSAPGWISADFLYDVRFNKQVAYGFEGLWNTAMHLVTDMAAFRTEAGNLNFIFSNDDDRLAQWRHFYDLVPLVLYHAVEVANALVLTIATLDVPTSNIQTLRLVTGLELWAATIDRNAGVPSLLRDVFEKLEVTCPSCSRNIYIGKQNARSFFRRGVVICGSCRTKVDLLDTSDEEAQA